MVIPRCGSRITVTWPWSCADALNASEFSAVFISVGCFTCIPLAEKKSFRSPLCTDRSQLGTLLNLARGCAAELTLKRCLLCRSTTAFISSRVHVKIMLCFAGTTDSMITFLEIRSSCQKSVPKGCAHTLPPCGPGSHNESAQQSWFPTHSIVGGMRQREESPEWASSLQPQPHVKVRTNLWLQTWSCCSEALILHTHKNSTVKSKFMHPSQKPFRGSSSQV